MMTETFKCVIILFMTFFAPWKWDPVYFLIISFPEYSPKLAHSRHMNGFCEQPNDLMNASVVRRVEYHAYPDFGIIYADL